MAVLNIQITNASLPDIEGGIGTGVDNGTWISTSYLIGEIIVIPLTDYLSRVFSFRRFLLGNLGLFLVFSVACAFATNLAADDRAARPAGLYRRRADPDGVHHGPHQAAAAQQPIGLAIFALSATFAPAIGPTIGGYLTENYGWQYIFFVNLVPGAVMLALLLPTLERSRCSSACCAKATGSASPPWRSAWPRCRPCSRKATRTTGSVRPSSSSCRSSPRVALTVFVAIELTVEKPLSQLRLLMRRNFGLGTLANVLRRLRAVRLGLRAAGLSRPGAGLQCRADRHGAGLDRAAAAAAHPARAAAA